MAQIFHKAANTLAYVTFYGAVLFIGLGVWLILELDRSAYVTQVAAAREQPVPFSHKHHVGGLGIDCRYCHASVEESSFADIPPTYTCMSCHSQIWADSTMLEPVRRSFGTGRSLRWLKVHDLPDFVYFNHSIHVNKGIGCATCHGRVDQMPLTWLANPLKMEWCLGCHRQPELYVRLRDQVFNMEYQPPPNQLELGRKLVKEYRIQSLTDCYTCHR